MKLIVNVDNSADKITEFGAGAKLYWYRDNTSGTGAFTDATGSVALDPAQTQYEIYDNTGAVGHYYRTRVGDSLGATFDEFDPDRPYFQAGAISAYATLDALREYVAVPDNSHDNLLSDLLIDATEYITAECGRDFFRHPAVAGTEVRTFDGSGTERLRVKTGIISLDTAELAPATGEPYTVLADSDWTPWPPEPEPGDPYRAILLSDVGAYRTWYTGRATVRLTGVFGWPAVPGMVRKATLDLAREWYRQGPGGGGQVGVNQFGTPLFLQGMPRTVQDAIARYGWRQLVH